MKLNKYAAILASAAIVLSLTACGKASPAVESKDSSVDTNESIIVSEDKVKSELSDDEKSQKFMRYKNTVVYDVEIKKIEAWVNEKRMFLDVEKQECYMR